MWSSQTMLPNLRSLKVPAVLVLLSAISLSCAAGSMQVNNGSPTPEIKLTAVERDVKSMKMANFEFIFVIRRFDGGVFDSEDKLYVKTNSPADTNRFVLSDGDKAVVAGSSYKFEPEHLVKLQERFTVEDFSAPVETQLNNNSEANVNKPAEK